MGKGGGGGSQPTQTTAYQTNLPEYAQPYVMSMLGATQNQLFNTSGTGPDAQITGFKPYTPYSSDPTKYFAGPSSLQQSVYNEAGQMQTPSQFAPASGLAAASGMGQLGTAQQANMLGRQGMGIGQLGMAGAMPAFGAGQQYAQQVTDPRAMQAYMSPYQQAVTDVAKSNAVREAQIAQQQANLGSARQGTYGGARQALMQGERERNLLANLSNIQAQGSQAAYDKAMQAQQFGANLGLQGIQTGLQGTAQGMQGVGQGLQGLGAAQAGYAGAGQAASTLGNLGGAEQQADLARMGFQQQTGAAQQQYQQNIINQAIQDYATAQQYPMMQLGFMSNMLRGLPLQATTTQSYMAQPNLTTQAIAGLGTAAGAYKAFGMKEGGAVPGYAGPEGSTVEIGMKSKLEALADTPAGLAQVIQIAQSSPSLEQRKLANEVLLDKQREDQAAKQAEASIAQDQMPRGLAALPAASMDTLAAASGGIVAFADEGEVEYDPNKAYNDPYQVFSDAQAFAREEARRKALNIGEVMSPEYKQYAENLKAGTPEYQNRLAGIELMKWANKINRPGSTLSALVSGTGESGESIANMYNQLQAREKDIATIGQDIYGKERTDKLGILTGTDKQREETLKRIGSKKEKEITAASSRETFIDRLAGQYFQSLVANNDMDPKDPATKALAMKQAIYDYNMAGGKLNLQAEAAIIKGEKDSKVLPTLRRELLQLEPGSPEYIAKQAEIQAARDKIRADVESKTPTRPEAPEPKKADKDEAKDGSGRFPAGTMNNPLTLPSKQEDLQKNKVYQTKRGPATWNGTEFVQK